MGGWYHATKHALEGWSDVLRLEVEPFGIRVIIVEPGAIATEWGGVARDSLLAVSGKGPYEGAGPRLRRDDCGGRPVLRLTAGVWPRPSLGPSSPAGRAPATPWARGPARSSWRGRYLPDRAYDGLMRRILKAQGCP